MKLVRIISVGLLFLGITLQANAQEKGSKSPEEKASMMTEKMVQELKLDQATAEKLEPINLKFVNEMTDIRKNSSIDEEAKKIQMQEIVDQRKGELKAILSEEQFSQAEEMEAKIKAHFKEKEFFAGSPAERAKHRSDRLKESLNLNDEQYDQIHFINVKVEEKIEVIKNDATMTPERKKEFIQGNRKDQINAYRSVLTPEQMEKLEKDRQQHKEEMNKQDEEK